MWSSNDKVQKGRDIVIKNNDPMSLNRQNKTPPKLYRFGGVLFSHILFVLFLETAESVIFNGDGS
ncbi:hypothetical protein GCM10010954_29300 [Halobacillus andaensis]|uniref:Uncharacterized protein n=1 Tax=Halobacillus andaensis TaxID=1176239 RepID=A0A917B8W7_HALAA|nr:hypothetical protein GCM10010954_29300 [Halobacillus andaensis]